MKKSLFGYSVQEVDEAIDDLNFQNSRLIEKNEQISQELKRLRELVADGLTKEDIANMQKMKDSYEALRKELNEQNEKDTVDREELQNLKSETETLRQQNTAATDEVQTLKENLEEKDKTISELEEKILGYENMEKDIQNQQNEGIQLKQELDDARKKLQENETYMTEAERTIQNKSEELEKKVAELATVSAELQLKTTRLTAIESEILDKDAQIKKLSEDVLTKTESKSVDSDKLADMELKLYGVNMKLKAAEADIAEKEQLLAKKENEVEELQEKIIEIEKNNSIDMAVFNLTLQKACDDIANVKDTTRQKLETNVDLFSVQWKNSQKELYSLLKELNAAREEAEREFFASEKAISERFEALEKRTAQLYSRVQDIQTESKQMKQDMLDTVSALDERSASVESNGLIDPESGKKNEEKYAAMKYLERRYGHQLLSNDDITNNDKRLLSFRE